MNSFFNDRIVHVVDDFEGMQYRVQAQLQKNHRAFDEKRLYPHMLELIKMYRDLRNLDENKKDIIHGLKQKADITEIDVLHKLIRREDVTDKFRENIQNVLDLAQWAFPLIRETISVGEEVQSDTEDHIEIDWIDLVSTYLDEGYFIISHTDTDGRRQLQVYTYDCVKHIADSNNPLYILHTKPKSVDSRTTEPDQLKRDLLSSRSYRERCMHPHPAVVFIDTSVPYPFTETVFPIAKRKFLKWIYKQENPDVKE